MNIKEKVLRAENEYPKIFANYIEKDYGVLFYDENNKKSHDSNHAILYPENITDIKYVLGDIKDFYLRKNITPRIYMPYTTEYFEKHRDILESLEYEIELYGTSRFMLLMDENNIHVEKELVIKRVAHKTSEKICFEAGFRIIFEEEAGSAIYYVSSYGGQSNGKS